MIIDVGINRGIKQEEPKRYRLRRRDGRVMVLDGGGGETGIDWRQPQPSVYSLIVDGVSYEVFVQEAAGHLAVQVAGRSFRITALDVRRHRVTRDAAVDDNGVVRLSAPIPGRVARVLAAPGQPVSRGDGIVVVEAMKMENELRAPRDGVVASVDVEEGQPVEGGALLATIQ